jgi:hypothetical protein
MRKLWVILISGAILGGVALFEIWSSIKFPTVKYAPESLPPLHIGVEQEYDYYKEGERVGAYMFWVEDDAYKGENIYFTRSRTSVEHGGTSVEIETVYIFDEDLTPVEYRLNATLGDDHQFITCIFNGWSVVASLNIEGSTVEEPSDLPEYTVLIDNFMLGHWDLFFKSFPVIPGKRIKFDAYIPQILNYKPLELITEYKPSTLNLNGVAYECQVVRAPQLNLVFYINEGNLIQMEETEKDIIISLAP